jgi:hypothetical protein
MELSWHRSGCCKITGTSSQDVKRERADCRPDLLS